MSNIIFKLTSQVSKILFNKILHKHVEHFNFKSTCKMDLRSMSNFKGVEDRFKGITVDSNNEECSIEEFPKKLEDSLKLWSEKKQRGIWFRVALEHTEWIPILVEHGFNFHHANPGYVMLYNWLPSETSSIPHYAHTMLAVGAIVVNDKQEILVVKEKYYINSHWKFPGGIVDPGEDLPAAAIREVKEETNIDCSFDSVICLRHAHKGMFECSDLYIVFSLNAINTDIQKCPREIMACRWMAISDFLSSEDVSDLNKLFAQRYLEYKDKNIKIECRDGYHEQFKKHYKTYSAVDEAESAKLLKQTHK